MRLEIWGENNYSYRNFLLKKRNQKSREEERKAKKGRSLRKREMDRMRKI